MNLTSIFRGESIHLLMEPIFQGRADAITMLSLNILHLLSQSDRAVHTNLIENIRQSGDENAMMHGIVELLAIPTHEDNVVPDDDDDEIVARPQT